MHQWDGLGPSRTGTAGAWPRVCHGLVYHGLVYQGLFMNQGLVMSQSLVMNQGLVMSQGLVYQGLVYQGPGVINQSWRHQSVRASSISPCVMHQSVRASCINQSVMYVSSTRASSSRRPQYGIRLVSRPLYQINTDQEKTNYNHF